MSLKHTFIVSIIMVGTMIFLHYISHVEDIHPNKSFSTFPTQIGEWKGKEERFSDNILDVLGVDDYFLANYYTPAGNRIQLYIGFYQTQREGDLIHSPKNCMPGAGWNIVQTSHENIAVSAPPFDNVKAIKLDLQKSDKKQIMLYWFQSRGRIISSEYMQKIYLVIDSITRHRTDGSFVRLTAPITGDEKAVLDQLKKFTRQVMPYLNEYIPS